MNKEEKNPKDTRTPIIESFYSHVKVSSSIRDLLYQSEVELFDGILGFLVYYPGDHQRLIEKIAYLSPLLALRYCKFIKSNKIDPLDIKLLEEVLSKKAFTSYSYAFTVLQGRFPLGEPEIIKSSYYKYYYLEHLKTLEQ